MNETPSVVALLVGIEGDFKGDSGLYAAMILTLNLYILPTNEFRPITP